MTALLSITKDTLTKELLSSGYVEGALSDARLDLERMIAAFKTCCDAPMCALCFYKMVDDEAVHKVYHWCEKCGKLEEL